jgi:hypothetical protein
MPDGPAAIPGPVASGAVGSGAVGSEGSSDAPVKRRAWDMSRRGFLRTGSIGVVAAGVVGSVPGLSSVLSAAGSDAPALQGGATELQGSATAVEGDTAAVAQSFSARVSNVSTGEMRLFVGNQTLHIQDPELAQRLTRAARAAQAARP